jgi:hypothetical protein
MAEVQITYSALNKLAISLGFGNEDGKTISEIGTECFADLLLRVCKEAEKEIKDSHKHYLAFDANYFIADRLHQLIEQKAFSLPFSPPPTKQ